MDLFKSVSPYSGEQWAAFPVMEAKEIDRIIEAGHSAFLNWRWTETDYRVKLLLNLATTLEDQLTTLSQTITNEMGKPIVQSEAEIRKCAWLCRYYAENASEFLKPEYINAGAVRSYVRKDPQGGVLAIMPWNYPFWQVLRCAIPAILAGNHVVLKHAPETPMCAVKLQQIFESSGFPDGLFRILFVQVETIKKVINDRRIRGVALTGSTLGGAAVAAIAGRVIKPVVLELGGSDPFIVLEDANLRHAVSEAVNSRFKNSGQSCIAAKRIIVVKSLYESFCEYFIHEIKAWKTGDPLKRETDIGPLAKKDLNQKLMKQFRESVNMGAEIKWQHEPIDHPCFFSPTVINHVTPAMPCFSEETFGPLAVIVQAEDEQHAIQLANQSDYGLGASLWTEDLDRAEYIASFLDSGTVVINEMVQSDPRLPFGGVKQSGIGRELGRTGLDAFVNLKTVMVNRTNK